MQKIIITGNLTRDPESRTTTSGKTVCNFTVAVNRREKDENGNNKADFFRIAAWGQMGEACQKYLSKGRNVCVVGTVSVHAYAGQDGSPAASMDIFAQDVEFLSPAGQNGSNNAAQDVANEPVPVNVDTDELPF